MDRNKTCPFLVGKPVSNRANEPTFCREGDCAQWVYDDCSFVFRAKADNAIATSLDNIAKSLAALVSNS
jgi:hypothetical protein